MARKVHRDPRAERDAEPRTPLGEALERVGDRWTLLIVEALLGGPRRFGDLLDDVAGIAPNILTARLRHLEQQAVVVAVPYSERPPRFVYELSGAGMELAGALRLLADWGGRQTGAVEPIRHQACGTALEARWFCPACEITVDDPDIEESELI